MLTLLGNLESGNVHKIQMMLAYLNLRFARVDVAQTRDEPRRPEFLALNPMGKVPVVVLDGGDVLAESGAVLYWFGRDTPLWPRDSLAQTEVLRWMFFEQYSHEPALAVLRYARRFATSPPSADRVRELENKSRFVLAAMDGQLARRPWIAGSHCTLADYALYPYTKWADEADLRLEQYSSVEQWLRFEAQPRFLPLGTEGAVSVKKFQEYFGRPKIKPLDRAAPPIRSPQSARARPRLHGHGHGHGGGTSPSKRGSGGASALPCLRVGGRGERPRSPRVQVV